MTYNIAVVAGDGIGPEIIGAGIKVAETAAPGRFHFNHVIAGGKSIDDFGVPLTDETLAVCRQSDSVLLGAVGGPKWDRLPGHLRPERALLGLRKELGLFANIRPARLIPVLKDACPLRAETAAKGFNFVIIRELTGGLYYGERGRRTDANGQVSAFDTEIYSEAEIDRIAKVGFDLARRQNRKLCSVDKANVLESSRLWRERVHNLASQYPEVELSDMLVDNAAMQLIKNPGQFDVIVTANMFGDILSDEASQLTGSIGLLPSASLGEGTCGMYEPIHGSAPDIAGKNLANPIATIFSIAMMMRMSFAMDKEAALIEEAVMRTLEKGHRTADILDNGTRPLGTTQMTDAIIAELK